MAHSQAQDLALPVVRLYLDGGPLDELGKQAGK